MTKTRYRFAPMVNIQMVSDNADIFVAECDKQGVEVDCYEMPIDIIINYLNDPSTKIIEVYQDIMVIEVEED